MNLELTKQEYELLCEVSHIDPDLAGDDDTGLINLADLDDTTREVIRNHWSNLLPDGCIEAMLRK